MKLKPRLETHGKKPKNKRPWVTKLEHCDILSEERYQQNSTKNRQQNANTGQQYLQQRTKEQYDIFQGLKYEVDVQSLVFQLFCLILTFPILFVCYVVIVTDSNSKDL